MLIQGIHEVTQFSRIKYFNECHHMRVLVYKLTCCISNTITMTIEADTSTTLNDLCVVINLNT